MTTTAVLGAGALGLTVAYRLASRGEHVIVLEREPIPGGLAAGFEVEPGVWLEKFYHHLFRGDRHAIGLINELGLGDDLVWRRPLTVTLRDGEVHQLDSPMSLLRFRPLPMADRLRMGAALAYLRLLPSPNRLEGTTAADWIRRRMGQRAYDVVWGPLLRGKFGALAETIAMPWFWARVHDRTAELGYLRGGFQRLYNRLAERIAELGGDLRFGTEVREVRSAAVGGFTVDTAEDRLLVNRVVSTLAVRLTCRLVPELPQAYRERHEWGQAYGAHCLVLAFDRPLTGTYWMNINDPGFPFMALVEHTNYMDPADYGGRHLVYLGNYRPMDDPLMKASTTDVVMEFVPSLARINPALSADWITDAWSFAAPFAQPIVTVDYRDHIPPFETPIPDLWVASMFQVYPHDRGQNYSIDLANRLVARLR
ncbi:MAG TPA: NAD(P)/FAD-dependent oxidoreductase [candidate division Zixibacteria bacterium]|nr:NAD(P)/FAD-dependent oxidoreductase [candidate division Zixibacteria bacterium]